MKKSFFLLSGCLVTLFCMLTSCNNNADQIPVPEAVAPAAQKDSCSKIKCNYLYLSYDDGDNNLVNSCLNDIVNIAYGLNDANENVDIRVLCLFDGISPDSTACAGAFAYSNNNKFLNQLEQTRLFEIKGWKDNYTDEEGNARDVETYTEDGENYYALPSYQNSWSEFEFSKVTEKDYTEHCGFIPKVNNKYEVDMSSSETLAKFLDFAYEHYDPKYVFLKFSDHGSGTVSSTGVTASRSVCYDDTSATGTAIGEDQISKAIKASKFKKVDILHMDACLEATIENAYEFKDCVDYYIASPNVSTGVPWDDILGEYWEEYTTPYDLAKQIITEAAYQKSNRNPITVDDNGSKRVELNCISPTYTLMDLSKADEVTTKLSKVINIIWESAKFSKEKGFLNNYDNPWYASLSKYIQNSRDGTNEYVPSPADYMVACDFSFLLARNAHGWVGEASDTNIIVPFDCDADEKYPYTIPDGVKETEAYKFVVPGKMTTMFYNATYSQLIDIGYLMDMLIHCTEYGNPKYSTVKIPGTAFTYGEFVDACEDVKEALERLIIFSHRSDLRKCKRVEDKVADMKYSIQETNFYLELSGLYNYGWNHYGVTICAGTTPSTTSIGSTPILFKNLGGAPAATNSGYSESYRGSCKFLEETRWLDLLDLILPAEPFGWNEYDSLSDTSITGN